jgi:hypothetical protein
VHTPRAAHVRSRIEISRASSQCKRVSEKEKHMERKRGRGCKLERSVSGQLKVGHMMNSERGSMASQTIENENLNKDEEVLQQATQGLQLRLLMLSRRAPVATVRCRHAVWTSSY